MASAFAYVVYHVAAVRRPVVSAMSVVLHKRYVSGGTDSAGTNGIF